MPAYSDTSISVQLSFPEMELLSNEAANYYLESQRDPIIGSQTGRCKVQETASGWVLTSSLPIEFNISKPYGDLPIDWNNIQTQEAQGNALWKYSIGYLPTLLEQTGSFELTEAILDSLWTYTCTDDWQERASWMTSLDHCIAVRLRAICTLFASYSLVGQIPPKSLFQLLAADLITLVEHKDEYFPTNNHGAMTAISILHSQVLIPSLFDTLASHHFEELPILGARKLHSILDSIFDDYGIASENSPEYQNYWISLLKPLPKLLVNREKNEQPSELAHLESSIKSTLDQAENALQMFTDSEGKLLPIGDSHPRRISNIGPQEAVLISENSGFAVFRNQGLVMSFNCGSTNYAHKHCDDSSITLSVDGISLLTDGGFFNHDWNDERTIYTKSQAAHSGIHLRSLDDLHPGKLYFPNKERVSATLTNLDPDTFHVSGEIIVDNKVIISRAVRVEDDNTFEVVDSISGPVSEYGGAVRRFLIPQNSRISVDRDYLQIERQGVTLLIFLDRTVTTNSIEIYSAYNSENRLRGWVSNEMNSLSPAHCIEVPMENNRASVMKIKTIRSNA